MQYKILYTSDIHGNEIQHSKLIKLTKKFLPDTVIIGGDIAPKNFSKEDFIEGQRIFFQNEFSDLMANLKEYSPNIFLMMGNDDCSVNLDVLKLSDPKLYKITHNKRIKLTKDFDIVGYSNVPITPFGIKDWEKYDFSKVPNDLKTKYLNRKISNYRLDANISTKKGWKPFSFTPEIESSDSIQKDLSKKLFTKNPDKTLYVIHSPPDNTGLDLIDNDIHVGSMAIRRFIETYQPYLTLHGHIHETVEVSGNFKDKIGKTLCSSSGNCDTKNELAVLLFDLYNINKVKRIII